MRYRGQQTTSILQVTIIQSSLMHTDLVYAAYFGIPKRPFHVLTKESIESNSVVGIQLKSLLDYLASYFKERRNSVSHSFLLGNYSMFEVIYNLALPEDTSLGVKSALHAHLNSSGLRLQDTASMYPVSTIG